ncbi:MAG: cytochrome P450 [Haloarculaceae archaeon]
MAGREDPCLVKPRDRTWTRRGIQRVAIRLPRGSGVVVFESAKRDGFYCQNDIKHVRSHQYTEQVIRETLRLRPPSWAIFREAKVEAPLGDQRIRKGDFVLLPQWALHRDRRYFDRPEQFEPDRWETIEPSSTPAYCPFGAGPQACIGGQMALAEAQLVLAAVVEQFDIDIDSTTLEDLRPAGVLQPRGGIPATVTPVIE